MQKLTCGIIIGSSLIFGLSSSFAAMNMNPPTATSNVMAANAKLSLSPILKNLNTSDFPIIKSVELENGVYEIKAINYLGKVVKLKTDMNGNILNPGNNIKPISLLTAAQMLEKKGYQIQEIKISNHKYVAEVLDETGASSTLNVNAQSGDITS